MAMDKLFMTMQNLKRLKSDNGQLKMFKKSFIDTI